MRQAIFSDETWLGRAMARGLATDTMAKDATAGLEGAAPAAMMGGKAGGGPPQEAAFVRAAAQQGREAAHTLGASLAGFMREPGGPDVAAVPPCGFDRHRDPPRRPHPRPAYRQ